MLHRPVYRLIKPSPLAKEGVRSIVYDGKAGFIVQAFHFMPKSFGMRAGIVCFPRDEPNRWIRLIQMFDRRCETVRCSGFSLNTAQELSPDGAPDLLR